MTKEKQPITFWGNKPGKRLVDISKKGTKMVLGAVVAGVALGLGIKAYNSAKGS
jgi:hypothetical protein